LRDRIRVHVMYGTAPAARRSYFHGNEKSAGQRRGAS